MQSNKQCMKDIIKYISENINVKVDEDSRNIVLSKIGLSTMLTELSKDDKYKKDEIVYNLLKCHKYHLIVANISMSGNTIIVMGKSEIYDTTLEGEKFLNGEIEL